MKIVFMGTPDFSLSVLKVLTEKHDVVCVYTQAPKEAGRGQKVNKTPVHIFAEENGIEVRTPKTLRLEEEQRKFKDLGADIAIVAAYGLILPLPILEAFPKGCINVHASLLPRWRGAAPIQRCIEAGDKKSGVTIMNMEEGLDTGDMLLKGEVEITPKTTGGILHDQLSYMGAELMVEVLDNIDNIKPEKQDGDFATYAKKIEKEEGRLDFNLPAEVLERKIRAFNPYPATYFEYKGERFKVLGAKVLNENSNCKPGQILVRDNLVVVCGKKMLEITQIQRQGKKIMSCCDCLKGFCFEEIIL
ncbi:MAG: methionyl-tRNA formyltransferase [Lactobacillaceae bacterium]|jgi:methionyl-tRNA formyltransferase|nr:methionyl-tRNA formyltransferase [Lactobacillaceae bacterium]